jgi:hypothetical protein
MCLAAAACAAGDEGAKAGSEQSEEDYLKNAEQGGKPSQKWLYQGMLPALEKPEVFVSLKAHTARVTGLLPVGFAGDLPFYADSATVNGRNQVTVVYPIATGHIDPSTGLAPAAPGVYSTLYAVPYTPTNDHAPWGGFPFMLYNPGHGIAFHGPITSTPAVDTGDLEWHLYRGPVSHGCNRMAGEHVVELASLLGVNMGIPHKVGDKSQISVKITVSSDFDTFNGKQVDVDYPAEKGVTRPAPAQAKLYKTWLSDDFPRFVCAYDPTRPLDAHHCDSAGQNRRNPLNGASLSPPATGSWIGSACTGAADCSFTANTSTGSCSASSPGASGLCTIPCEGYCPDKAGASVSFCATFPDGKGRCVVKADTLNQACAAIPGTAAKVANRYIGASTAKAASATVCLPK